MKIESAGCFVAAVAFHGLVLFGFRMEPARPLAMSDEAAPVDVSLVEAGPEAAAAAAPAPPAPEPPETPPTPEIPSPPPAPTPDQDAMVESTPAPEAPKASPRPPLPSLTRKHAAPHAAPGAAATLGGASNHRGGHGAPGGGGPGGSGVHYLSNPKPDYPAQARRLGEQGVVVLGVEVGANGRANDVSVSRGSGYPELDEAAVRAVRRWMFEPARAAGLPVASHVDIPVRFSLSR